MKKEKWVQINKIQGFEEIKDQYWISNSNEDKIINRNIGKIRKIRFDKDSYPIVSLRTKNDKYRYCRIHILKAKAFLFSPNPLAYNIIRHLNDIKTDNRLENLAFGTQSDNMKDCIRNGSYNYSNGAKSYAKASVIAAKKLSKPVRCIETDITYISAHEAERQTGISSSKIIQCCRGKRKTSKGFHWEYVNKEEI